MKRHSIDHEGLARRAERLNARLSDAARAVQDALERERLLGEGDEANREELAQAYPGLKAGRRP